MTFSTSQLNLLFQFKTGSHIQSIRSITVIANNASSIGIEFQDTVRLNVAREVPINGGYIPLNSDESYNTVPLGEIGNQSFPDRFQLYLFGIDNVGTENDIPVTLVSILITYDC